ncbi:MAG TPA: NAD+ synthase [Desulfobulbus sp.]|nr:NAD+ synthase [Desulfobulbus sp.]
MNIALIQINPVIGDFDNNLAKIHTCLEQARAVGCHLAVFPELSLCGYPPRDLLERASFLDAHDRALQKLVERVQGIACVIGVLERRQGPGRPLYNSAFFINEGTICFRVRKQLLPTYDVFDESRYFEPGGPSLPFSFAGVKIGLSVCEDIWPDEQKYPLDPIAALMDQETVPDLLINISASPYYNGKLGQRSALFSSLCRKYNLPLLYVNQVGGQDELIFDGHSMVLDGTGTVRVAGRGFSEDMIVVDTDTWESDSGWRIPVDSVAQVLDGLTLGVRDYMRKIGFNRAVLGLSGGIDSAVTAAVACRALGPENVLCIALPSPYTSQMSIDDARLLAENMGCGFELLPIGDAMQVYAEMLSPLFDGLPEDVTEQNLQARIRGTLLMALSNKLGHLLLSTGNKSEMAVGYCTLYGDMNGGLAVLADVPKAMVYELARWINTERAVIPERIITRPPTAELKPDQLDQDDLPPYEILDPILKGYLEEFLGVDELVARGFDRKTVQDIIRRIKINEYKRRQSPMGLKVTSKAFGHGRRYPVAQGFVE